MAEVSMGKPSTSANKLIVDGWFYEEESMLPGDNITSEISTADWSSLYAGDLAPGQKFGIQVDKVLFNGESEYQVIVG
jgi:hypothetical protein